MYDNIGIFQIFSLPGGQDSWNIAPVSEILRSALGGVYCVLDLRSIWNEIIPFARDSEQIECQAL